MMHYWYNYPNGYYYGSGFNLLGFIFTVLFWGLVILLIVRLFKGSHCCQHEEELETKESGKEKNYLEIVKERYAKGEINKKEFEQLKKDLS